MLVAPAGAQIHSEDFDDANAASRFSSPFFSVESGLGLDGAVDLALDYSTLGVVSAPNSVGGTTIGLGIQVNNVDDPVDEGIAIGVSPLIASLPGDYLVKVDANVLYVSGAGASEHAVVGVNAVGDAVPFTFAPAGAGQFYHFPHDSGLLAPGFADDYYRVADGVVTELYNDDPNDAVPHPDTLNIPFPADPPPPLSEPGFAGSQWVELELRKLGDTLTFLVNGVEVDQYDIGGGASSGNIVLAGSDIFNSNNDLNWILFDNLRVEAPAEASADFDGDNDVDGADFLTWQRHYGTQDAAAFEQGDADKNGDVDDEDFAIWQAQFGDFTETVGVAAPEPGGLAWSAIAVAWALGRVRRHA
jgi:hypothetical protein